MNQKKRVTALNIIRKQEAEKQVASTQQAKGNANPAWMTVTSDGVTVDMEGGEDAVKRRSPTVVRVVPTARSTLVGNALHKTRQVELLGGRGSPVKNFEGGLSPTKNGALQPLGNGKGAQSSQKID